MHVYAYWSWGFSPTTGQPVVTPEGKRDFRAYIAEDAAKGSEYDPIEIVRRIAEHSDDVLARLKSIRMLARELASSSPPSMELNAKWKVVR